MTQDDLEYLHRILCNLDGDVEIEIGSSFWTPNELCQVVKEALQARAWLSEGRVIASPGGSVRAGPE